MAGKRHHTLPRFIQKGFASRVDGEKVFTWLYRKGELPFEASTRDVAVGKLFYETAEETADPEITAGEADFGALVTRLRETEIGSELPADGIPEFIAHLLTRSKHFRDAMEGIGSTSLELFDAYFADPTNLRRLMAPKIEEIKRAQDRLIEQVLALAPPEKRAEGEALLRSEFPQLMAGAIDETSPMFQAVWTEVSGTMRAQIPDMVKTVQVQALRKSLAPEARVQAYATLHWSIQGSRIPQVLGDVAAVFEVGSEGRFKPYDEKGDLLIGVYLPLTPDKVLVGRQDGMKPNFDPGAFRMAYIRACRGFFIASTKEEDLIPSTSQLGVDAEILRRDEMDQIFKEALP